jgi:hypothetical protein
VHYWKNTHSSVRIKTPTLRQSEEALKLSVNLWIQFFQTMDDDNEIQLPDDEHDENDDESDISFDFDLPSSTNSKFRTAMMSPNVTSILDRNNISGRESVMLLGALNNWCFIKSDKNDASIFLFLLILFLMNLICQTKKERKMEIHTLQTQLYPSVP